MWEETTTCSLQRWRMWHVTFLSNLPYTWGIVHLRAKLQHTSLRPWGGQPSVPKLLPQSCTYPSSPSALSSISLRRHGISVWQRSQHSVYWGNVAIINIDVYIGFFLQLFNQNKIILILHEILIIIWISKHYSASVAKSTINCHSQITQFLQKISTDTHIGSLIFNGKILGKVIWVGSH